MYRRYCILLYCGLVLLYMKVKMFNDPSLSPYLVKSIVFGDDILLFLHPGATSLHPHTHSHTHTTRVEAVRQVRARACERDILTVFAQCLEPQ